MKVKRKSDGQWTEYTNPLKTDVQETIIHGIPFPNPTVAGNVPFVCAPEGMRAESTSALAPCGASVTIPFDGVYTFHWGVYAMYNGACTSRLYKNGSAVGTQRSTPTETAENYTENIECSAGDVVELYLKGTSYSSSRYGVGCLFACIDWDNTF